MKEQDKYPIYKKGTYADGTPKYIIKHFLGKSIKGVATIKADKIAYLFNQSRSRPDKIGAFLSEYVGWVKSKHGQRFAQPVLSELLEQDNIHCGGDNLLPKSKIEAQPPPHNEPTEAEIEASLKESELLPDRAQLNKILLEDEE